MNHTSRVLPNLLRGRSVAAAAPRIGAPAPWNPGAVVRGRAEVIALRPLLHELARRTGQSGWMEHVELLVKAPTALRKRPHVVLVGLASTVAPEKARACDVEGAVLLYEYLAGGLPTGVFASDDVNGYGTVLAPAERRAEVQVRAGRRLIEEGGMAALISLEMAAGAGPGGAALEGDAHCHVGTRVRSKRCDLPLAGTVEQTLARVGSNTRRNFRRYRERAERELGARFVGEVRMSPEEFLELHRSATHPVSPEQAEWRYHMVCCSRNRILAGVRAGDGRWLSLVAGTREDGLARIEWQVNRAELPAYSLSTVMRSYLLEREIALGTRCMRFQGGTPHAMAPSLAPAETLDVVVLRRGVCETLVRGISGLVLPESNFLRGTLEDPELHWSL